MQHRTTISEGMSCYSYVRTLIALFSLVALCALVAFLHVDVGTPHDGAYFPVEEESSEVKPLQDKVPVAMKGAAIWQGPLQEVISNTPLEERMPFWNPHLPLEDRARDIVSRLTIGEKISMMSHGGATNNGPSPPIKRLGIKPYQWGTECLTGDSEAGMATSFPAPIGLAATFDKELVRRTAHAIGLEVRAKNTEAVHQEDYGYHKGLSCFSPVVNIMRHPLWGRNMETFGECPYLSGEMGAAFVRGLQGDHPRYLLTIAGCKHFDVHGGPENIPELRFSFDAKVSEFDWQTTFLPQFKACVDAGAVSLMCSYNRINGVPACANRRLLSTILRDQWGFKGYVVSDQEALELIENGHHYVANYTLAATAAANAGCDLELGNDYQGAFTYLHEAWTTGLVSEEVLNTAVKRLFLARLRLGEFDPPEWNPWVQVPTSIIQSKEHQGLSLETATKSIVLLKNDGTLPLSRASFLQTDERRQRRKIAMVGPYGNASELLLADYSPDVESIKGFIVTPAAGIADLAREWQADFSFCEGCQTNESCALVDEDKVREAVATADVTFVILGVGRRLESEGSDRSSIRLPGLQEHLLRVVTAGTKGKVILVLISASPVDINWAVSSDKVQAILSLFLPGQTAGLALRKVVTGEINPGGRLPYTWPRSESDVPSIVDYKMRGRTYRFEQKGYLFPFGYGLSYTSFRYSRLKLSSSSIKTCESIQATFTVKNVGKRSGEEVVQVYVAWGKTHVVPALQQDGGRRIDAPALQLVDFMRLSLSKNEERRITITLPPSAFALYITDPQCTDIQKDIEFLDDNILPSALKSSSSPASPSTCCSLCHTVDGCAGFSLRNGNCTLKFSTLASKRAPGVISAIAPPAGWFSEPLSMRIFIGGGQPLSSVPYVEGDFQIKGERKPLTGCGGWDKRA